MNEDRRLADIPDEELGRIVRKLAEQFRQTDSESGRVVTSTAALFLVDCAVSSESGPMKIELEGVTLPEPAGDWEITVRRKEVERITTEDAP